MGDWSLLGESPPMDSYGRGVAADGGLKRVPASISADTYGSWVNLASKAGVADGFFLHFYAGDSAATSGTVGSCLIDVAITDSSERLIIPDILYSVATLNSSPCNITTVYFPLQVPLGAQVQARSMVSFTEATAPGPQMGISLIQNGWTGSAGASKIVSSGSMGAPGPYGTSLSPDSSAHTLGSWASLGNIGNISTGFYLCLTGDYATNNKQYLVELSIDNSSHYPIVTVPFNVGTNTSGSIRTSPSILGPFWFSLPDTTTIYARCQCGSASGPDIKASLLWIIP